MSVPYERLAPMISDDTDPAGSVEAGLAALLEAKEDFEHDVEPEPAPGLWPERRRDVAAGRRWSPGSPAFWRYGFPAAMAALALIAFVLFRHGLDDVLKSRSGTPQATNDDPSGPGWEAVTSRTPTLLVVQTGSDDKATGFAVLTLSSDRTGGVLVIPPSAAIPIPGVGAIRFDDSYARNGVEGVKASVELLLGAGLGEVAVIDSATWSSLTEPVGSIRVDNRDAVKIDGKVVFGTGSIAVEPADVGRYLSAPSGESDVNRLLRNENFWRAWIAAVRTSNTADDLPGETDSGIGRFVRGFAEREVQVVSFPSKGAGGGASAVFSADDLTLSAMVTQLIPFPVSPFPGVRLRARLLDGTGKYDHGVHLASSLVQAGTELVAIGNAKSFDVAVTQIVYYDDANAERVKKIASALGVGQATKSATALPGIDVDVILGADADAIMSRQGQPVVTSPPSSVGTTIIGGTRGATR